ncbi:MAG: DNA-directed RNA polymerase subunit alpha [Simkaniaceae bacterium]|nr:DNA-directed RNA polymerase subunit alpha [Simkaniaceae bacterium]MCF7851873.1 DNA-directed RNA polymerase subunit alpha [Simkaniaceae bacterium]
MGVRYGKFELPTSIKVEESDDGQSYARFIAEPLERGFGHTLGNALRRIMLTSLEAPAIISVKIEGIAHEFMASEGIVEDMTHIILNLKNALLRKLPSDQESQSRRVRHLVKTVDVTEEMIKEGNGQYIVTLQDLIEGNVYDIVNPKQRIFTVTKPTKRRVDLKIAIGRGYVPSERHLIEDKIVDEIAIDSPFSPVRLVNYFVENTRVGRDTDFDRLVLEVKTDGRVTAQEALSFATQIGIMHLNVFEELKFQPIIFEAEEEEAPSDRDVIMNKLCLRINEIELSVRSTNCLSQANIDTIAELVIMPESDMLKFRNFGKKSLNEIKAKLDEMGLHLGMDLSKYGVTKDNVHDVIREYLNEKMGKES